MPNINVKEKIDNVSRFYDITYWYRRMAACIYAGFVPYDGFKECGYPGVEQFSSYSEFLWKGKRSKRKTLNTAFTMGNYVVKNMYSELPEIKIDNNEEQSKRLNEILEANDWNILEKENFAGQFHLGDRVIKIYIKDGQVKFDYVNGMDFFATRIENKKVISGVIVTQKEIQNESNTIEYFTRLEWHYGLDEEVDGVETGRVIKIELYKGDTPGHLRTLCNNLHERVFGTIIKKEIELLEEFPCDQPTFVLIKNPIANNKDLNDGRGLGAIVNSIPEMQSIDEAFTAKSLDNVYGSIKMSIPEELTDEVNSSKGIIRHYDAQSPEIFIHASNGDDVAKPEVFAPTLRTDSHIQSINTDLDLASAKVGISVGAIRFDGKSMQTATAKIIERSDTASLIKEYELSNTKGYEDLFMLIKMFSEHNYITDKFSFERDDIVVDWKDNIAEDDAAVKEREYKYVENGDMATWEYYVRNEGMTEEEAKLVVKNAIDAESEKSEALGLNNFGDDPFADPPPGEPEPKDPEPKED